MDILACNVANKPSFQNPTKSLFTQRFIDVKSAVTTRDHRPKKCLFDFKKMV